MRTRFPKVMGLNEEKFPEIKEEPFSNTVIVRRIQKCSLEA